MPIPKCPNPGCNREIDRVATWHLPTGRTKGKTLADVAMCPYCNVFLFVVEVLD